MKKQPDKGKITALYERLSHDDEENATRSLLAVSTPKSHAGRSAAHSTASGPRLS